MRSYFPHSDIFPLNLLHTIRVIILMTFTYIRLDLLERRLERFD